MTAFYFLFYIIATVLIILRCLVYKRICGLPFVIYFAGSLLLILMAGSLGLEIANWQWTHGDSELDEQCQKGSTGVITDINIRYTAAQ